MKFVIIGLGQFGRALALYLTDSGYEVTVLERQENLDKEVYSIVNPKKAHASRKKAD